MSSSTSIQTTSISPHILDPVARLRHLSDIGGAVEVNNDVPIVRYLRSGPQMDKMARTYYNEGQLEQAFILYNKFATLYIEKVPKHPEYSKAPATDKSRVKKLIKPSLEQAMLVKDKLKKKYEEEKELYCRQQKEIEEAEARKREAIERREREERERRQKEEEEKRQKEEEAKRLFTITTPPTIEKTTPTTVISPEPHSPNAHSTVPHPQPSEPHPQQSEPRPPPTIQVESDDEQGEGPEDSWAACDNMLLLSNNQPYLYEDGEEREEEEEEEEEERMEERRREEEGHVSLTATDTKLSKVLPSLFHTDGPNPLHSTVGRDGGVSTEQIQQHSVYQTPPTNNEAPPSDYNLPPTDPQDLPPNYQAPPPPEYQAPPTSYQAPLPGYQAPPYSYQVPHQAPPTSYQAPPTGYQTSPTSYQAPPTGYQTSPTSYQAPPTGYQTSPTSYQAPPTGYQTSPTSYQAPPTGYQAPPTGYHQPIGSYQTPPNYSPNPSYGPAPTSWGASGYYQAPMCPPGTTPTYQPAQTTPTYQPSQTTPTYQPSQTTPPINRDTKPDIKPHVITSLGGLEGVRSVVIPGDAVSKFQSLASPNTRQNIETCGILGGKLAQSTLCISHIIIPKQTGKADSCETLNEEELFDAVDKYDLITLGWIHTHPSQTAFMSSVDLHTHCSYQLMLEEAIAIVCAPRYNQIGVYTLTQPHGLNYISKCNQKGFHSHPKEPPLYEECKHIQYDQSISVKVLDLR